MAPGAPTMPIAPAGMTAAKLDNELITTKVKDIESLALHPTVKTAAALRLTRETRQEKLKWKRNEPVGGCERVHDFADIKPNTLGDQGAVAEASRCLKCADAPCSKSCPTSIDVKAFIQCIATRNFYGAARLILTDNPVGLSCGMVCPVSELCAGSCNLSLTEEGPININGLQHFAVNRFLEMRVPQTLCPKQPALKHPEKGIALVGAGPASICCANFLGRLGYRNIVVYEKSSTPGGLSALEIPQFRLNYQAVVFETRLCEDLGVKFVYNKALGRDFSLEDLRNGKMGPTFDAVFLGAGLYRPKLSKPLEGLNPGQGVWTSKTFLRAVAMASKPLEGKTCGGCSGLPDVGHHALVLGAGDTAFDCATSAFRCGAKRVTIVFRKTWVDMRAVPEERDVAIKELCDFVPNALPNRVEVGPDGRVTALEVLRTEKVPKENDSYGYEQRDTPQLLQCTAIISAFGCGVDDELVKALGPITLDDQTGTVAVNTEGKFPLQCKDAPWAFCGGDLAGGTMTVEAANDGKTAAWSIHKYLQGLPADTPVALPFFHTPIDEIDISVTMCGVKFPNPFGLASAPCSTSGPMIRRAFEAGWGFAVTKTFTLDKHLVTNVSPRIARGTTVPSLGPGQPSFLNIELITEKTAAYWIRTIQELKRDFPSHVMVASIMAPYVKEEWEELTLMTLESGCDIIEMNLSCPHGMGEVGMGLACGQEPELVKNICTWVKAIAGNIPVFPKLTPNVTEIAVIAKAAVEGGADGVTAINTVSGIMDTDGQGQCWPRIGYEDKYTTRGGISGDANRPLGLRAVSMIRRQCQKVPIMATGGVSSADSTLQYIRMGASVAQISSAIQNQDFTVIDDYVSGLKTALYMAGRKDLAEWNIQTPPVPTQTAFAEEMLPNFGATRRQRITMRKARIQTQGLQPESMDVVQPVVDVSKIPALEQIIGITTDKYVRNHNDLSRDEQVIASIREDLCINCGKCYMTCNDNAYQAITFNALTHQAVVDVDKCTGCGLCLSVCPINGCIDFIPRPESSPHHVDRGIVTF